MDRVLPMEQPFITSYPGHANLLAVIMRNKRSLQWIYSHFIALEIPVNKYWVKLDFYMPKLWENCPWINYQKLDRELASHKWGGIIPFIKDCVDRQYYVNFVSNHRYLPPSWAYQQTDHYHETFIFGYNDAEQTVYAADFFQGRYEAASIPYDCIEEAFRHVDSKREWLLGVEMYKLEQYYNRAYFVTPVKYEFDPGLVIRSLEDYLAGTNLTEKYHPAHEQYKRNYLYGIRVYDQLVAHTETVKEGHVELDHVALHALLEHKQLMRSRIHYMRELGYISALNGEFLDVKFGEIEDEAFKLRNVVIKYMLSRNRDLMTALATGLRAIAAMERQAIPLLITSISRTTEVKDLARSAVVHATSVNINEHEAPQQAVNGDRENFYASELHPELPQSVELAWESPQTFNEIKIWCFDGPSVGVTELDVVVTGTDGEDTVVGRVAGVEYDEGDGIKEYVHVELGEPVRTDRLKLVIKQANINPVIIMNEIEVFCTR